MKYIVTVCDTQEEFDILRSLASRWCNQGYCHPDCIKKNVMNYKKVFYAIEPEKDGSGSFFPRPTIERSSHDKSFLSFQDACDYLNHFKG